MQVERYTCGCEPVSLTFCHLHSPEPADRAYVLTRAAGLVGMFNSGRSDLSVNAKRIVRGQPLVEPLEGRHQRGEDPGEQPQ